MRMRGVSLAPCGAAESPKGAKAARDFWDLSGFFMLATVLVLGACAFGTRRHRWWTWWRRSSSTSSSSTGPQGKPAAAAAASAVDETPKGPNAAKQQERLLASADIDRIMQELRTLIAELGDHQASVLMSRVAAPNATTARQQPPPESEAVRERVYGAVVGEASDAVDAIGADVPATATVGELPLLPHQAEDLTWQKSEPKKGL